MDWAQAGQAIINYLIYVSPPVVGAVSGVLLGGYFVQRYWVRKANESALIEYLSKELHDLVDETLEYWSIDCSGSGAEADRNRQQARKLEQKLKGAIKNLGSVLNHYSARYCPKQDFTPLLVELSDACTGGTFEQAKRPADPHRYLSVINTSHRVRAMLFERRV
jgi:hypothetical protein